jgi:hypothetical protein
MRSEKVDRGSLFSTYFISIGVSTIVYTSVVADHISGCFSALNIILGRICISFINSRNDIK